MSYCNKCGVSVRTDQQDCPLCQAKMSQIDTIAPQYPFINKRKSMLRFYMKLLAFATALVCVVSVIINMAIQSEYSWSLFVLFGAVCFWISFYSAVKKRDNLPKNIVMQVVFINILCVAWDMFTGFGGWSLDYVIPCVCAAAMIALAVLGTVLNLPMSDYIFCLMSDIAFAILPAVFWLTGKLKVILPSAICIGLSILAIVAIALFRGHDMKLESQKRFHM